MINSTFKVLGKLFDFEKGAVEFPLLLEYLIKCISFTQYNEIVSAQLRCFQDK